MKGKRMKSRRKQVHCFLLMPFAGMDTEHDFYKKICNNLGVSCKRIDSVEHARPGVISTEILSEIRKADIIIADTSQNNPNVFYEIGFAHANSFSNVIMTRNKDSGDLPFDIKVMRTVFYKLNSFEDSVKFEKELETFIINIVEKNNSPMSAVCDFYKSLSEKTYQEAWSYLSPAFKARRWNNDWKEFVNGYKHTHSISHIHVSEEVTQIGNKHAVLFVRYLETVDAPVVNELKGIGRAKLSEIDKVKDDLELLYARLEKEGFEREIAESLTFTQAIYPNNGQILSWLLERKFHKNPDKLLGHFSVTRTAYCYEVYASEERGSWLITKIRQIGIL